MTDQIIHVLDHGYVRLTESMGNDLSVVRAARVSHNADWRAGREEGSDIRLIHYLWKNKHTSPFESVVFSFEVKAPIFVFRQWHRHRTWSYNEVSARYTELDEEYYTPQLVHIGVQSTSNKQVRNLNLDYADDEKVAQLEKQLGGYQYFCNEAFAEYKYLLQNGWPRELARMVLPVSTYSRMVATVDLRNLLHFLDLRLHPHAQYEIRVYAEAMRDLVSRVVPVCMDAWQEAKNG